jgi:hypothetical protein
VRRITRDDFDGPDFLWGFAVGVIAIAVALLFLAMGVKLG